MAQGSPQSGRAAEPAGLRRAFSSLGIYNYRLYWLGQLVSQSGTWMQRLAQAWLVLHLTHSAFKLGLVTTLQFVPLTLLSLFGGVVADKVPKRRLLIMTQSVAAVQAFILAALTTSGVITLWEIYALALLLGLTNALDQPTRQAFPVELVGREEIANAIALTSTLNNTTKILGPSMAGIAIATIGVGGCFWLNAFSFVAVIIALAAMKPHLFYSVPPKQRGRTLTMLRAGVTYAAKTPSVCALLIPLLFLGTFAFNFNVVLPLLATYTLHTNGVGYGLLFAVLGAGSLLAALFLAYTRSQTQRSAYVGGLALLISLALLGLSHTYLLAALMLACTGAASISYSNSTQTRLQILVPDKYRGRTMSLYTLFFNGTTPFGSLFIGAVSERWDPGTALIAAAGLSAIGLVLGWLYLRTQSEEDMLRGTVFEPEPAPVYAEIPSGTVVGAHAAD